MVKNKQDLKKVFFFTLFFIFFHCSQSQFLEFGGGVGVFSYTGDLARKYYITNTRPAISAHHRMNFSEYLSFKWALKYGGIAGSDDNPIDAFSINRNAKFKRNVFEFATTIEYYFLDYKHKKAPVKFSPYLFGGISVLRLNDVSKFANQYKRIQVGIPFGLGFVHLIGRKHSVGFEFGVRKTYFDQLDGVAESSDISLKDYQYGNPKNNDFYTYIGFNFTYIIYKIPCPFPYIPNAAMLKR